MALISLNNLERFFNNLKTYISNALSSKANMSHTHTTADISNLAENWNVTGTNLDISFAGSSNNNGQLSIQINGTDITTFMANQITNSVFNLNFNSFGYNLIPATDNSIDVGSSTKNIKMLYTKGITINGTQFLPNDYIPRSGGAVISGDDLCKTVDTSRLSVRGGTNTNGGATITMYGKDWTDSAYKGAITLGCYDGSNSYAMRLYTNGTLTWGSKNVAMQEDTVPRAGGAVMSGNLFRTADDGTFVIGGGKSYTTGASIYMRGALDASEPGWIYLSPRSGIQTYKYMILKPDGSLTWNGTAIQYTSDQRLKQQITQIDDDLLTAWEDVDLVQFKYNDAVEQKGKDKARLHTGYVVQQIDEACKKHNVDISKYGLYCHEEYQEETREVEQADGTKETKVIRPASEHYSLRYTEALIVECAYLRKCIKELKEEIKELKNKD